MHLVQTLRAGLPAAAHAAAAAHGRPSSPVVVRGHPLRQRDGDRDGPVELPPPRLNGDDGADGAALHEDVLHGVVLHGLRAQPDLGLLCQGPGREKENAVTSVKLF